MNIFSLSLAIYGILNIKKIGLQWYTSQNIIIQKRWIKRTVKPIIYIIICVIIICDIIITSIFIYK